MRHRNVPLAFAAMIVLALAVCQKSAGRMGAEEQGGMGDIRLAPDFATSSAVCLTCAQWLNEKPEIVRLSPVA